jgi:hypothetical protein
MKSEDQWFISGMIVFSLIVLSAIFRTPALMDMTLGEPTIGEPLAGTILWMFQVFIAVCAICLIVLVGRGTRRVCAWWRLRASPALPINRIVTIQLSVRNDFDDFKRTKDILEYLLERKRGPLRTGFLTWLNNKPPREMSVMSISPDHDESVSSMHQPM